MKPELQIKALAELDGYGQWSHDFRTPPPYLTSYDAIIPLIQKQPHETRFAMSRGHPDGRLSFMSTPAQLCEVLLRATGKWIES